MSDFNYDALIRADPAYQASVGDILRRRQASLVQFGDASYYPGADAQTVQAAQQNPYSTLHLLGQQHAQMNEQVGNNANTHGVLHSGATVQGFQNEAQAALQRSHDAAQNLLNALSGYNTEETNAYTNSYARLSANPPGVATPPAAAASAPAGTPAAPPPPGVSNGFVNFTPTEDQGLLKPATYRRPSVPTVRFRPPNISR